MARREVLRVYQTHTELFTLSTGHGRKDVYICYTVIYTMLEMITHHLKRHRYHIVVGVPMIVLIASSLSLVRDPQELCVVPEDTRYVVVGEEVTLDVMAQADQPINVISASIRVPVTELSVESLSKEGSIITLWSEEPSYTDGVVHFSGGVVTESGFSGSGKVLSLGVRPLIPGEVTIYFDEVHMLAHDGTGSEVSCGKNPIVLSIREEGASSPDVNQDKRVNIFDFGLVSMNILLNYEPLYDLNNDGKVSLSDVFVILSNLQSGGSLESLALFWNK
jgi:hypothetical protein